MASTSSANDTPQVTNNAPLVTNSPITNPHVPNPCSYLLFDLRLIPTYTHHQLQYYHLSGAMLSIDRAVLKTKMVECKADLELLDWDGNTCENTPISTPLVTSAPLSSSHTLSLDDDSEVDSNCLEAPSGQRGIKFSASDITKLCYDSNIAQFNNWLEDLKVAFDGDPAKFHTSHQKIILASMTVDEQLKTTYNSTVHVHPAISTHW